MKASLNNNKGFTMVEVLVAFASLAIGMTAIWALHISSLKVDLKNTRQTSALNDANQILEIVRNIATSDQFAAIKEDNSTTTTWLYPKDLDNHTVYNLKVVDEETWRKKVTLEATWKERIKDRKGVVRTVPRSITLYTYVVDPKG